MLQENKIFTFQHADKAYNSQKKIQYLLLFNFR